MSSDSDFTPLVTRLRQDGLLVYGFGSAKAPEAFKTACTRYIDVDQLIRTSAQDDVEEQASTTDGQAIGQDLNDLLGAAWTAAQRARDGYALVSGVGNIAGNRSSFDVRNHGFKRLSDLFRANESFRVEDRNGHLYV